MSSSKKERGIYLTIMLGIVWLDIFGNIWDPENITQIPSKIYPYIRYNPSWYSYFQYGLFILITIETYGLWTLKKWGIYLYLFTLLIAIVDMFITLTPTGLKYALIAFVPLQGLYAYAIYRKRESFD